MTEDSIKKRYFFKLLPSIVQFSLALITMGMVPKALGPAAYGVFGFLQSAFQSIYSFLEMGTTSAFFTYVARKKHFLLVTLCYAGFVILVGGLSLAIILLSRGLDLHQVFWPDVELQYIFIAALSGFIVWASARFRDFADATGNTVLLGKVSLALIFINTGLLCSLYFTNKLTLTTYFVLLGISPFLLAVILSVVFVKKKTFHKDEIFSSKRVRVIGRYFYRFSAPLFLSAIIAFVNTFGSRWFLQQMGGAEQQGYYTLAVRLSMTVLFLSTAITPIFLREITKAHGQRSWMRIRELFQRFTFIFFTLSTAICSFLAVYSDVLIRILTGDQFLGASWTCFIMFFYPISRTSGQLTSCVFLAFEKTKIIRNIALFTICLDLPLLIYFVSPAEYFAPGLGLGALGLAFKEIISTVIVMSLYLFGACRFTGTSFIKFVSHHLFVLVLCLVIAYLLKVSVPEISLYGQRVNMIIKLCVNFSLYVAVLSVIFWFIPQFVGTTRDEICHHVRSGLAKIQ